MEIHFQNVKYILKIKLNIYTQTLFDIKYTYTKNNVLCHINYHYTK